MMTGRLNRGGEERRKRYKTATQKRPLLYPAPVSTSNESGFGVRESEEEEEVRWGYVRWGEGRRLFWEFSRWLPCNECRIYTDCCLRFSGLMKRQIHAYILHYIWPFKFDTVSSVCRLWWVYWRGASVFNSPHMPSQLKTHHCTHWDVLLRWKIDWSIGNIQRDWLVGFVLRHRLDKMNELNQIR